MRSKRVNMLTVYTWSTDDEIDGGCLENTPLVVDIQLVYLGYGLHTGVYNGLVAAVVNTLRNGIWRRSDIKITQWNANSTLGSYKGVGRCEIKK